MSEFLLKAQQRHLAIRDVLLKEWDPIGVAQFQEAQNEYDGYVAEVDALVTGGSSQAEIFAHLWKMETGTMGLVGDRQKTESIAKRLFEMGPTRASLL